MFYIAVLFCVRRQNPRLLYKGNLRLVMIRGFSTLSDISRGNKQKHRTIRLPSCSAQIIMPREDTIRSDISTSVGLALGERD